MDFIYITNDPSRARIAERAGVDRVMVDLEVLGKKARQGHRNTVISGHSPADVTAIRQVLLDSKLMVRVNPLHPATGAEVDDVMARGAEILMLPMFSRVDEVREFIALVAGRAKVCLLLETGAALARAEEISRVEGVDEIHIGLNDLHLSLGLDFMFELLSGGVVEYLATVFRARQIKFGFGGVARLGCGPLLADWILSEHQRLGSSQVILSRDFNRVFDNLSELDGAESFCREVRRTRTYIDEISCASSDVFASNTEKLRASVSDIVDKMHRVATARSTDT